MSRGVRPGAGRLGDRTADHERAVERVLHAYAALPASEPVRLGKRTSNLFRARSTPASPRLDVSGLDGVVWVDPAEGVAKVQGMATYERLVDDLLASASRGRSASPWRGGAQNHRTGWVPLVVPQLRTITIGGAVTGLGIEAASFRNGLPH